MENTTRENNVNMADTQNDLFRQLPVLLRANIIEYLFDDIFYRFKYFFKYFDKVRTEIALFSQPRLYLAGSTILEYGICPGEVLFKDFGLIEIGTISGENFQSISLVSDNIIIGDYFVLQGIPSFLEIKAVGRVKGFSLPEFAIKTLIKKFKLDQDKYVQKAATLYKNIHEDVAKVSIRGGHLGTEDHVERSKLLENDSEIFPSCILTDCTSNSESFQIKGVESIKSNASSYHKKRKVLINDLKERLISLIS